MIHQRNERREREEKSNTFVLFSRISPGQTLSGRHWNSSTQASFFQLQRAFFLENPESKWNKEEARRQWRKHSGETSKLMKLDVESLITSPFRAKPRNSHSKLLLCDSNWWHSILFNHMKVTVKITDRRCDLGIAYFLFDAVFPIVLCRDIKISVIQRSHISSPCMQRIRLKMRPNLPALCAALLDRTISTYIVQSQSATRRILGLNTEYDPLGAR